MVVYQIVPVFRVIVSRTPGITRPPVRLNTGALDEARKPAFWKALVTYGRRLLIQGVITSEKPEIDGETLALRAV